MESNIKHIEAGGIVFKESDKQESIFFLQSGLVILYSEINSVELLISPGQVLEIFDPEKNSKHQFTATALTDVKLLLFTHETYLNMWRKTPGIIQTALKQSLIFSNKSELELANKDSIEILFSLLKMIFWSGKDAEKRPISINQILMEMANLGQADENIIRGFLKKLDTLSLIKIISDNSFLLSNQSELQLMLEFLQDMILANIENPWNFFNIQDSVFKLLKSLITGNNNKETPVEMKSFEKIVSSSFQVNLKTVQNILRLWKGKNFIKFNNEMSRIFLSNSGLQDLDEVLHEYKYCRNKVLNMLLVSIPEYSIIGGN